MTEYEETCGAEYPLGPGQEPCQKPKGHEHGPATDWKRGYHSNGLLKWRADGADMPGDVPRAAAARAILRAFGITGDRRRAFYERLVADPMLLADELAVEVLQAVRHADRVLGGDHD